MTANEIRISWDKDNDVLHVLKLGADENSISNIQVDANIVLRVIKDSANKSPKEIVGFIIDDFSVVCPEWKGFDQYHLMEEFDDIIKILNDKCARKLTQAVSEAASSS